MSVDTHGKIKGFIKPDDIVNFIKNNWDENVKNNVTKRITCPLTECTWKYKVNEHSDDNENWYSLSGHIMFTYNGNKRTLFYDYESINSFENLKYYTKYGLEDMVNAETTYLSLGCWGDSVDIIKTIVAHFGGGWIDENDCDEKEYYIIDTPT